MKNLIILAKAEDFKVALVVFLCLAAMGIWILYEAANAEEGYEDKTGFHKGKKFYLSNEDDFDNLDLDPHERKIS